MRRRVLENRVERRDDRGPLVVRLHAPRPVEDELQVQRHRRVLRGSGRADLTVVARLRVRLHREEERRVGVRHRVELCEGVEGLVVRRIVLGVTQPVFDHRGRGGGRDADLRDVVGGREAAIVREREDRLRGGAACGQVRGEPGRV